MIIVADSGSTKTDWAIIKGANIQYIQSVGVNPYFLDKEEIGVIIYQALKDVSAEEVKGIYFYGAGTSIQINKEKIKSVFSEFFPFVDDIIVDTDMLGAAKALFKDTKGIACILGTGSNSCLYDGKRIIDNVNSLGYLLGDNGSGAVLGLKIIQMYMQNKLSKKISEKFNDEYNLDYRYIMDNVYSKPTPNKFLAKFSPFIYDNLDEPEVLEMVKNEFREFIKYFILNYDNYKKLPIRIIGSIGYHYESIIAEVFQEFDLKIDKIIKTPIEDLANYYTKFALK